MKLLLTLLATAVINIIPEPAQIQVHNGFLKKSRTDRVQCTIDHDAGIAPEGYTLSVTRRLLPNPSTTDTSTGTPAPWTKRWAFYARWNSSPRQTCR